MTTDHDKNRREGQVSRRQLLALAPTGLLAAAPAWLAGCGGSDGGGPTLSDERRHELLGGLSDATAQAKDQSNAGKNAAADAYFGSHAEFSAHGISEEGGAWAEFADGRLVVTSFNRVPSTAPLSGMGTAGRARVQAVTLGFTALPGSSKAVLMTTLKPPDYQPAAGELSELLSSRGYGTLPVLPSGIEDWKQLGGISVVAVDSHGTFGKYANGKYSGVLASGTVCTPAMDKKYKADLDAGVLIYNAAPGDLPFYGLSSKFFDKYVVFDRNCIVFINACSLGSSRCDMFDALLRKGAGAVIGWDAPVADIAAHDTALFFFDRLLGADTVLPGPFAVDIPLSLQELRSALAETINPRIGVPFDSSPSAPGWPLTRMRMLLAADSKLGGLVPSIRDSAMDVAGPGTVRLSGLFGELAGKATEYDDKGKPVRELTVQAWGESTVDVKVQATTRHVALSVDGARGNVVEIASAVTLDPASARVRKGSELTLTATTPIIANGSVRYRWSLEGGGTLTESPVAADSQMGTSFDSSHSAVVLKTRFDTAGPSKVTVQAFSVVGATITPMGSDNCVVTLFDPELSLTPAVARLNIAGGSQVFTVAVSPALVPPANLKFRYAWSCASKVGTLTSEGITTSAATQTIETGMPSTTYTVKEGLVGGETESLSCRVFYRQPLEPGSQFTIDVDVGKPVSAKVEVKPPFSISVSPAKADVPTDSDLRLAASIVEPLPAGSTVTWAWDPAPNSVGALVPDGGDADQPVAAALFRSGSTEGDALLRVTATITPPAGKAYKAVSELVKLTVKKGIELVMEVSAGVFACTDPLACGVSEYTAYIVPRQPKAVLYKAVLSGFAYAGCNRSVSWSGVVGDGGDCNFPITYHPHSSKGATNAWAVWIGFGGPVAAGNHCVVTITLAP